MSLDIHKTASFALANVLAKLGVEWAFGIFGRALAPFSEALIQSPIEVVHFRHESGAAFAAVEAYFASAKPAVVFTTTGPGLTNALTGIMAAGWEGAKVVLISAATPSARRGRWAFQETNTLTMPANAFFAPGSLFDFAVIVEDIDELQTIANRLANGLNRPGRFVAHLCLSVKFQVAAVDHTPHVNHTESLQCPGCPDELVEKCTQMMTGARTVIWTGFGARDAAPHVLRLAEALDAPVISTPRGKGTFPENHPLYLGVTGIGGHNGVSSGLSDYRPAHILVLGTRLGEYTSFWDARLTPSESFIHVDIDPDVFGAAYPHVKTIGVHSDVGTFVQGVLRCLPGHSNSKAKNAQTLRPPAPTEGMTPQPGRVRPDFLMAAVQRVVVNNCDTIVMTEAGNSFAWGSGMLAFRQPRQYRTSVGFGSMGQASAGVVGAALARGSKAVAIVGDGAVLMFNEISTAVQYGVNAVWIVLNDGRYGMVYHGLRAHQMDSSQTRIPSTDFLTLARSLGADGIRVTSEAQLDRALEEAMSKAGPFVVDVHVDPEVPPPVISRVDSLTR